MREISTSPWRIVAVLGLLLCAAFASAAVIPAYKKGSPNTVTADPKVPRPDGTPCVVQLFQKIAFEDFDPKPFDYAPPAQCPGPWQKVVLTADFSVTPGVQFDRTGNIWLGSTAIYFGTTAEPSPTFGPHWHVETDLTDYTPLFLTSQTGQVDLGNVVNGTYTGIIYGTAAVEFYPMAGQPPERRPFDQVLPLSSTPGTVTLTSASDMISQTFTLPMNIQRAYLDVYAQSQHNDEFWYTCVPDDVSGELQSCPGTAFREVEVAIDGTPAGVASIFPWIYTGGIDPFLWFPLPGVQTLNFVPARVDLTPFAGVLSDGQQHTVSLYVFNADDYFSATASLLLTLYDRATQVTGAVTVNTLGAPNPVVTEDINNSGQEITGTVSVTSARDYTITGYIDTPQGRIETSVEQNVDFSNQQTFDITSSTYQQDIVQSTSVDTTTTRTDSNGVKVSTNSTTYPLTLHYLFNGGPDQTPVQTTTIEQESHIVDSTQQGGTETYSSDRDNIVNTTDQLLFDSNGNPGNNQNQASSQHYTFTNSNGVCYDRTLGAKNNQLLSVQNGCDRKK
jgi:hypothetical protein